MPSDSKYGDTLRVEFNNAFKEQKFGAVVVNSWFLENYPEINKYYEKYEDSFSEESTFWVKTGFIVRPEFIYVPKKNHF